MGSSGSKATRAAAASVTRKYPSRPPGQAPPSSSAPAPVSSTGSVPGRQPVSAENRTGPTVHSKAQPSDRRTEAIDLDARDPHFAGRLSELGPVKPYPTFSNSSTSSPRPSTTTPGHHSQHAPFGPGVFPTPSSNPALRTLTARSQIQDAVEQEKIEAGHKGFEGRQYLDIGTLRKVLTLRDEHGMRAEDIERELRLKKGLVAGLGTVGVVEAA